MKTETRVMDVTTTLEGERVGMTIDENSLAHLMTVLTDLYSDPELAVIREYSTNAFDAHVESGVKRPIEVSTPTSLAPFFTVRDFGEGLDANDIRDIYSRYGASTKRNSNDVVGMLGLGCKSALTYTDQFTISGIKNGVCTQVSVSRDEDGSGSMTIVAEYETTDPSGVEIIVPVKRGHSFESKSKDFFRFWPEGTVLLNGKQPVRVNGLWLANDLLLTEEVEADVVVMGNVAYPMSEHNYGHNRYSVVAFVDIGEVNFTPSREALQMTKRTKDTLTTIKTRVKEEKDKAVQRNINKAKDHVDALGVYLAANRMEYKGKPVYKGVPIPERLEIPKTIVTTKPDGSLVTETVNESFIVIADKQYYRDKGWHRDTKFWVGGFPTAVFLVGYEGTDFTATKRKKLDQWITEAGIDTKGIRNYVLLSEIPKNFLKWIDPTRIYQWEDVKAQKIVRENQTRRDGRPSGIYDAYVNGTDVQIHAGDIDTSKPVFYVNKTTNYRHHDFVAILDAAHKGDYTYVTLPGNRVAKFIRDFPMAVEITAKIDDLVKQWKDSLTEDQIVKLVVSSDYYRRNDFNLLARLDETQVDDPEIKAGIVLAKTPISKEMQFAYDRTFKGRVNFTTNWTTPLSSYPLLQSAPIYGKMNAKLVNDLYLYVNAAYAAGKAGN